MDVLCLPDITFFIPPAFTTEGVWKLCLHWSHNFAPTRISNILACFSRLHSLDFFVTKQTKCQNSNAKLKFHSSSTWIHLSPHLGGLCRPHHDTIGSNVWTSCHSRMVTQWRERDLSYNSNAIISINDGPQCCTSVTDRKLAAYHDDDEGLGDDRTRLHVVLLLKHGTCTGRAPCTHYRTTRLPAKATSSSFPRFIQGLHDTRKLGVWFFHYTGGNGRDTWLIVPSCIIIQID